MGFMDVILCDLCFSVVVLGLFLCRSVVPLLFTMSFIFQSCALEFQQSVAVFGDLFWEQGQDS